MPVLNALSLSTLSEYVSVDSIKERYPGRPMPKISPIIGHISEKVQVTIPDT